MAGKKASAVPADKLALYERLLAAVPGLEMKANFGAGYTSVNGNMFSMISKHGVVGIRLPADKRAAFLQRLGGELFRGDPAWPPAKEYVAVPDALLPDTAALAPYLAASLKYAEGLKPKPTKKR
ncbi:MAG TPA: hypothetical protein VIQ02_12115 [Jiangellaceae bacterium]|jgi:hypothetical protein